MGSWMHRINGRCLGLCRLCFCFTFTCDILPAPRSYFPEQGLWLGKEIAEETRYMLYIQTNSHTYKMFKYLYYWHVKDERFFVHMLNLLLLYTYRHPIQKGNKKGTNPNNSQANGRTDRLLLSLIYHLKEMHIHTLSFWLLAGRPPQRIVPQCTQPPICSSVRLFVVFKCVKCTFCCIHSQPDVHTHIYSYTIAFEGPTRTYRGCKVYLGIHIGVNRIMGLHILFYYIDVCTYSM